MVYVPVPNTIEVEIRGLYVSQRIENVFYVLNAGPWDGFQMESVCAAVEAWIASDYADLMTTAVSWDTIVATDLTTQTGLQVVHPIDPAIPGTVSAGTPLPNEVAFVVKHNTLYRGRSFRGRTYIPGLTTGQMATSNSVTPEYAAAAVAAFTNLRANIEAVDHSFLQSIVSRYHGKLENGKPAPREIGLSSPITTSSISDLLVDSRKSRKPGVGE